MNIKLASLSRSDQQKKSSDTNYFKELNPASARSGAEEPRSASPALGVSLAMSDKDRIILELELIGIILPCLIKDGIIWNCLELFCQL